MGTWQVLLVVYVAAFAMSGVFVAVTAWLLGLVGGRATRVDLGTPPWLPLRRAAPAVRLGPLPLGVVHILGAGEPAEVHVEPAERDWRRLGLARQLLVTLGPWLVLAMVAVALLGPPHAARSFASAVGQLLFTLDPTPLVRRFFALAAAAPLQVTLGVLFAKLVVLNLLPFGSLAGGQAVGLLLGAGRRAAPRSVQIWIILSTVFVMLYLGGRFIYAIVRVLLG